MVTYLHSFWDDITYAFPFKASLAAVGTAFAEFTGGHEYVLMLYLAFATADFFFGTFAAIRMRDFSVRKMYHWLRKVCTQLLIVISFTGLCKMLFYTASLDIALANWLFFLFAVMDCASIFDNMERAGLPVPPFIDILLRRIRRRAVVTLTNVVGDADDAEQFEEALKPKHARKSKNTVSVRRAVRNAGAVGVDAEGFENPAGTAGFADRADESGRGSRRGRSK